MQDTVSGEQGQTKGQALFLSAYVLLVVCAFTALTPVLQIIVPLHAGLIDPSAKTQVLSQAVFWGAATAAVSNIVIGALSDRTRTRFGKRSPWIASGGLVIALSYLGIARAETSLQLTLAVVGFQIAFNMLMAPLLALFAERVSLERRTTMSAILGVCYPLAVALGSSLMALGPQDEAGRLSVLAGLIIVVCLSFTAVSAEPSNRGEPLAPRPARQGGRPELLGLFGPFASRDFTLVWSGRLLLSTGYALIGAYLLYFIGEAFSSNGRTVEISHSVLTGVSLAGVFTLAAVVAFIGPRLRSRKPVAIAGAVLLCLSALVAVLAQEWGVLVAAFVGYGLGQGAYGSVEIGLMADVLPSDQDRGKDMGLINLTVALPQAIAPLIAVLIHQLDGGVRPIMGVAAFCFGAAALLMTGLKANSVPVSPKATRTADA